MRRRQAGVAAIELALGFALLLVPMALVVLSFAPLLEARASARSGAIAAARTIVVTGGDERAVLAEIERMLARDGHEAVLVSLCDGPDALIDAPASSCLGPDGVLDRGQVVSVALTVRVEVLPVIGESMTMDARHHHAELVDLYRSIPRP